MNLFNKQKSIFHRPFSIVFFLFTFTLNACVSDKPEITQPQAVELDTQNGIYISNEGNFQFGNAAVSYYNTADSSFAEDLFKTVNNRSLGDVCQSICFFNNKAYIVVNNSGRVEVVDAATFKALGVINGLTSPRYFIPINHAKAYVSDLYSNSISIIDLNTLSKIGSIACAGWTEQMLVMYGKAYITNLKHDKVYIVNTATDLLEDSIVVGYGSSDIREDKHGNIWVLCVGDNQKKIAAGLYKINPLTQKVDLNLPFPATAAVSRLRSNSTNDTLYYLNKGVYQLPITQQSLPTSAFISENGRTFYGLGIQPKSSIVYISDAIDYVQKGTIFIYNQQGKELKRFKGGIIPGDFYFNYTYAASRR